MKCSERDINNRWKKADKPSQDAPHPAGLMNGNRCVWLCGGSWRIGSMWHVYCLGDLGQWSTSGTSHNRVHTSTALRHPTRRAEREGGMGKETSGFSLTHTLMHWGFWAFWSCLDYSRCIWHQKEKNRSVCLDFKGSWVDWQFWSKCALCQVTYSNFIPTLSFLTLQNLFRCSSLYDNCFVSIVTMPPNAMVSHLFWRWGCI